MAVKLWWWWWCCVVVMVVVVFDLDDVHVTLYCMAVLCPVNVV